MPSSVTKGHAQLIKKVSKRLRIQCVMIALAISGCAQPVPIPIAPKKTTPIATAANRSIWDGVYTEEQRRRGETVYIAAGVRCHGKELERDDLIPEMVGEKFLKRWSRKRAGNLFAYMKAEMPPKVEERLTPPEYADVLAYLLSKNQAPVGEEELPSNFAALQAIRMARSD